MPGVCHGLGQGRQCGVAVPECLEKGPVMAVLPARNVKVMSLLPSSKLPHNASPDHAVLLDSAWEGYDIHL